MKKIIITSLLTSSLFAGTLSHSEITKMVMSIKKERVGISLIKLENTGNPFIINIPKKEVLEEIEKEKVLEVEYIVDAIFNNAVFINKKWYRKNDTIGNYKIGKILSSSVVLKSSNGNRVISLKNKKNKMIKLNRGNK